MQLMLKQLVLNLSRKSPIEHYSNFVLYRQQRGNTWNIRNFMGTVIAIFITPSDDKENTGILGNFPFNFNG